jgi:hypothetical protein
MASIDQPVSWASGFRLTSAEIPSGGYIALEAARLGIARSVVAISPAACGESTPRTQLRALDGRLVFTYLSGLSMSALLQQMSNIPQRAVIYYLTLQEDADGNKFNVDALDQIAAVANRPIYTWVDVHPGRGAIWGSVMSNDVVARASTNACG